MVINMLSCGITKNLIQPTTTKNIRESKFRKRRPSFNLRFKLTKDENCEMVIFRFYCKIIFNKIEISPFHSFHLLLT